MRKRLKFIFAAPAVFALIFTILLGFSFIIYIKILQNDSAAVDRYYIEINESFISAAIEAQAESVPIEMLGDHIKSSEIEQIYLSYLFRDLPFLLLFILFFLLLGSIILAKILLVSHEKHNQNIASALLALAEGENCNPPYEVSHVCKMIDGRIKENEADYSRLLSFVAHEQKNTLSLLRAKLQLNQQPSLIEDVDHISKSLDDILTLCASPLESVVELVDSALVCASVCDEYRKLYKNIVFNFEEGEDYQIYSRELWLNRALSNIITNAIKYAAGEIKVNLTSENGSVIVEVSDEGEGVNEDEIGKIFEYRYRIGGLKKDGYGIGLNLVRHVCDISGGVCLIENAKSGGAVFYLVFPKALILD